MAQAGKKTDWGSMTGSLIPAIIGGATGGPMGALAGFGKGASDISAARTEHERYTRDQEMKQAEEDRKREQVRINQQQMNIFGEQEARLTEQSRIDQENLVEQRDTDADQYKDKLEQEQKDYDLRKIEEERLGGQLGVNQRQVGVWEKQQGLSAEKFVEEKKRLEILRNTDLLAYKKAERSEKEDAAYAATLTPKQQQIRTQLGKQGYLKFIDQNRRAESGGMMMSEVGVYGKKSEEFYRNAALSLGSAGVRSEMERFQKSGEPKVGTWIHRKDGTLLNTTTGKIEIPKNPYMPPNVRARIRDNYRKAWKDGPARFSMDFEAYMETPIISTRYQLETGQITNEQYKAIKPQIDAQEKLFRRQARAVLMKEWQAEELAKKWGQAIPGVRDAPSEAEFSEWMQTREGMMRFVAGVDAQRQLGAWPLFPAQTGGAGVQQVEAATPPGSPPPAAPPARGAPKTLDELRKYRQQQFGPSR